MEDTIKSAKFEQKKQFSLPKDATILKNDVRVSVSEIENGFIISKDYDIKWQSTDGECHYDYITKQWYSQTNPITIDKKAISSKKNSLVSALDEDNNSNTLD